jgi:hypothetical protein
MRADHAVGVALGVYGRPAGHAEAALEAFVVALTDFDRRVQHLGQKGIVGDDMESLVSNDQAVLSDFENEASASSPRAFSIELAGDGQAAAHAFGVAEHDLGLPESTTTWLEGTYYVAP